VRTDEGVRGQVHPSFATEAVVGVLSVAVLIGIYWADRRYGRWVKDNSVWAGPRLRAAGLRSSYQLKRSGLIEATQTVGAILGTAPR
jgi:hypothetical protein